MILKTLNTILLFAILLTLVYMSQTGRYQLFIEQGRHYVIDTRDANVYDSRNLDIVDNAVRLSKAYRSAMVGAGEVDHSTAKPLKSWRR